MLLQSTKRISPKVLAANWIKIGIAFFYFGASTPNPKVLRGRLCLCGGDIFLGNHNIHPAGSWGSLHAYHKANLEPIGEIRVRKFGAIAGSSSGKPEYGSQATTLGAPVLLHLYLRTISMLKWLLSRASLSLAAQESPTYIQK